MTTVATVTKPTAVTKPFDFGTPDYAPVYAQRMERIRKIRDGKVDLAALNAYYAEHPADWINDFGVTFDPRLPERGLPAIVPFIVFPKQRNFIDCMHKLWLGRQDGVCVK